MELMTIVQQWGADDSWDKVAAEYAPYNIKVVACEPGVYAHGYTTAGEPCLNYTLQATRQELENYDEWMMYDADPEYYHALLD